MGVLCLLQPCVNCKHEPQLSIYLYIPLAILLTLLSALAMFYFNVGMSPVLDSWLFFVQVCKSDVMPWGNLKKNGDVLFATVSTPCIAISIRPTSSSFNFSRLTSQTHDCFMFRVFCPYCTGRLPGICFQETKTGLSPARSSQH